MKALVEMLGPAPDAWRLAAALPPDPHFRRSLLAARSTRARWERIADYLGEELARARTAKRFLRAVESNSA